MATKADEFEPSQRVIERVFTVAVQPSMVACEQQRGILMTARLTVWVLEKPDSSWIVTSTLFDATDTGQMGEMRLRFRQTYRPERLLFSFKSLYKDLDPGTGFSGFSTRGDIIINEDRI